MNSQSPPTAASAHLTEHQARELLDTWRQSGASLREFARRHGLNVSRLYRWRAQLESKPRVSTARQPSPAFLPVTVRTSPAFSDASGAAPAVEIVFAGITVKLCDLTPASARWLAQLAQAMQTTHECTA